MRNLRLLPVVCLTLVFVLSSCVSKKKWNELVSDKDQLDQMLSKTQQQVKDLEDNVATLSDEKTKLQDEFNSETTRLNGEITTIQSDLSQAKKETAEMKDMISTKDAKIKAMADAVNSSYTPFTAKGLALQAKGGSIYLNQPIHFKSGSTRITEDSKATVQAVYEALMANAATHLVIEGHTDDVPMKEGAPYASNKALSKARANSVKRALVRLGANGDQITAMGHGSDQPVMAYEGAEEKEAAREQNRRAEFAIVPASAPIYEASQSLK